MRFAFGEDEVKRIARVVRQVEQDRGSSNLSASGPRHTGAHMALVKVTTVASPYSTGNRVDFVPGTSTIEIGDEIRIKEVNGQELTDDNYYVGFFTGYTSTGFPIFLVSAGGSGAGGGNASIEVVTDVTCTPTGLEVSTVTLSGANYDNAVIRNFLALSDVTPKSFLGNQGRAVVVNSNANALEFGPIVSNIATTFISLSDTPNTYGSNNTYKVLTVSSNNSSISFSENNVTTGFSLTGGGNPNNPLTYKSITLLNDVASPLSLQYYGTNSKSVRGWYDLPSGAEANKSITGKGTAASPLEFVNDEATPGNLKLYGTDGSGVRGWFDIAGNQETAMSVTGDGSIATPIKLVNDEASPAGNYMYGTTTLGVKGWIPAVSFDYVDPLFNALDGRVTAIENAPYATQSYVNNAVSVEATNRNNADIALDGRITTLEGTVVSLSSSITTINSTLTIIQGDISNLNGDISTINNTLSTIQSNITTLQSNVSTLQSSMTTAESNIATLQSDVSTLQTGLSTAESNITTLQSDVSTLQTNVTTLQGDVSTLQTSMTTAEGNITSLQSDVSTLQTSMTAAQGDITTLQTGLTTAEGNITTLQSDVSTLQTDLATAQSNIATLQTDLATAQSDIATLQTDLATAQSNISTLQSDYTALEARVTAGGL